MYKYLTVKEFLYHEDIGAYASYGIVCIEKKTGAELTKISDVSCDKSFVKSLSRKFTRLRLEPSNLFNAVELAIESENI